MGIPKTIDNDLDKTDHCPGYASAAKYIATSMMEIYRDSTVYDYGQITVVEIMGRNAGWLTAAASLASIKGQGPDLVYLPEKSFCMKDFLEQVEAIYKEKGKCLIAVSEGIRNRRGRLISDTGKVDSFGHPQLGGLAAILAEKINKKLNVKVRGIELSLLQRCAAHCASKTDIEESFAAGKAAVENAVAGTTDKMVGYKRTYVDGKYKCSIKLFDLTDVANTEKKVPLSWINKDNTGMSEKFIKYALPLIEGETDLPKEDGLPRFVNLKKVLVKK
jgi:6-phosphofructokinase 1